MEQQPYDHPPSTDVDSRTWIILAALLVLSVLIAFGTLALTSFNERNKSGGNATQAVPGSK